VREFDVRDISNLFELRFALKRVGLELGIPLLGSRDIEALKRIECDCEEAYETDPVDRLKAANVNVQFHQVFVSVAQNEWLVSVINNLDTYLHVVRAPLTVASTGKQSMAEHREILNAACQGDVAGAVERLRAHTFRLRDEAVDAHVSGGRIPYVVIVMLPFESLCRLFDSLLEIPSINPPGEEPLVADSLQRLLAEPGGRCGHDGGP
jgi:DNA-binding GntR family transcriptional regulator